jgi:ribonuclease HI
MDTRLEGARLEDGGQGTGQERRPVEGARCGAALHTVEWRWVRGHNGHPGNERADMLANRGVELARAG